MSSESLEELREENKKLKAQLEDLWELMEISREERKQGNEILRLFSGIMLGERDSIDAMKTRTEFLAAFEAEYAKYLNITGQLGGHEMARLKKGEPIDVYDEVT